MCRRHERLLGARNSLQYDRLLLPIDLAFCEEENFIKLDLPLSSVLSKSRKRLENTLVSWQSNEFYSVLNQYQFYSIACFFLTVFSKESTFLLTNSS